MAIVAKDGYVDFVRDKVENFHGNQLVLVSWDETVSASVCVIRPTTSPATRRQNGQEHTLMLNPATPMPSTVD